MFAEPTPTSVGVRALTPSQGKEQDMTTSRVIAAAGRAPGLRWGRSMLVGLGMAAAVAGAALSMASVAVAASLSPGDRYVALGSSFASGPGLAPITDPVCGRSEINYAQKVAEELDLNLTDVSCWFATTADLINGQTLSLFGVRRPPQIDAITRDTRLVTVTVGGNDTNYIASLVEYGCTDTTAEPAAASGRSSHARATPWTKTRSITSWTLSPPS
jgi:hypothetical protein